MRILIIILTRRVQSTEPAEPPSPELGTGNPARRELGCSVPAWGGCPGGAAGGTEMGPKAQD